MTKVIHVGLGAGKPQPSFITARPQFEGLSICCRRRDAHYITIQARRRCCRMVSDLVRFAMGSPAYVERPSCTQQVRVCMCVCVRVSLEPKSCGIPSAQALAAAPDTLRALTGKAETECGRFAAAKPVGLARQARTAATVEPVSSSRAAWCCFLAPHIYIYIYI